MAPILFKCLTMYEYQMYVKSSLMFLHLNYARCLFFSEDQFPFLVDWRRNLIHYGNRGDSKLIKMEGRGG